MAKTTKTQPKKAQSDPHETQKAWETWVWFIKLSKISGVIIAFALLVLLGLYLAG